MPNIDPVADHYARERKAAIARGEVPIEDMSAAELRTAIAATPDDIAKAAMARDWTSGPVMKDFTDEEYAERSAAIDREYADKALMRAINEANAKRDADIRAETMRNGSDAERAAALHPFDPYLNDVLGLPKDAAAAKARHEDVKRLTETPKPSIFGPADES